MGVAMHAVKAWYALGGAGCETTHPMGQTISQGQANRLMRSCASEIARQSLHVIERSFDRKLTYVALSGSAM